MPIGHKKTKQGNTRNEHCKNDQQRAFKQKQTMQLFKNV